MAWTRLKHGARRRGYRFSIKFDATMRLFAEQQGRCALSGLPLIFAQGVREHAHGGTTASLDRIDNTRGYVPGNVWWVHKELNRMKGTLSLEQFREFCRLVSDQGVDE